MPSCVLARLAQSRSQRVWGVSSPDKLRGRPMTIAIMSFSLIIACSCLIASSVLTVLSGSARRALVEARAIPTRLLPTSRASISTAANLFLDHRYLSGFGRFANPKRAELDLDFFNTRQARQGRADITSLLPGSRLFNAFNIQDWYGCGVYT